MKGIEVDLIRAQKVKKILISKGNYNKKYKPFKSRSKIIFPIFSSIKIPNTIIKEFEFEKAKNKPKDFIPKGLNIPSSYDVIGDIIILELNEEQIKQEKEIAQTLLKLHKSINTILKKSGQHTGEFRTQKLTYLAGQKTKETIYKENNTQLKLDVEKIYFSPRLSTERKRIFSQIKKPEKILVMFSGCCPYPMTFSKNTKVKKIIGIEKNPLAHIYAEQNILINKINNVEVICGDVRDIVPKIKEQFDRIVMPLPKDADTFLNLAFMVSKKGTKIHLYDFEHETEFDLVKSKISKEAKKSKIKYEIIEIVKCGQYSPGKFRICADFVIK